MAYCGCLENSSLFAGTVGSNPTPSDLTSGVSLGSFFLSRCSGKKILNVSFGFKPDVKCWIFCDFFSNILFFGQSRAG